MTSSAVSIGILHVTPDAAYASAIGQQLTDEGRARLMHASSLADAAAHASSGDIDVILLDLRSSGFSLAALDTLRVACAERIPIIALLNGSDDERGDEVMQHGAQDYLDADRLDAELLARSIRYARERLEWHRESRRREADLLQAQKMEAIGRLAGGVAHDFNNVLAAIFGYSDLLLEQFTDEDPRRGDVQEIRRAAERAAALTRQLLAFSRKQMMQPRVLNLNDVIGSLQKLLARLVGEDITLDVCGQEDLWQVRADPGQMEQVLMNLAANARDAMPEGGRLTIATANTEIRSIDDEQRRGLQPGKYVEMMVSDTGTGVPDSVRAHMFEPFFTTKEQGKGTGLGLATVYGIVKQSGGGVYVDSHEDQGTRFAIYLPRVP